MNSLATNIEEKNNFYEVRKSILFFTHLMVNLKYDEMRTDFNEGKVKDNQVFILTENFFDQIQNPCVYYKIGEPIVKTYLAIGIRKGI